MRIELTKERKILIITLLISWVLILLGILSKDPGVMANTIILSIFIVASPQLILNYVNYRILKEMEFAYPNFLRDLTAATKAGLPLHKAIISLRKNNYGPLSKEVRKMAYQLSWNVDVIKVLESSKKRLKKSPTLEKSLRILIESYKSGGRISEILDSLSNTLVSIQETEKDRKSSLQQYVTAMYIISLVFIAIVVAINKLMVPIFETSTVMGESEVGIMSNNPCNFCVFGFSINCLPCRIYSFICNFFRINDVSISCYYFGLFFSMSIVQSIAGGLVAGQIGEGSVKAGIKHSLILLFITISIFFLLVKFGVLGG
ncbi:MAG: type II secretion system F family protein [Candidatus Aenigmatarchaeota archaeon]